MRGLARIAGVSTSTVSKALRDDPTIPKSRCTAIKKLARKHGYRPHPMVSALMAQLHRQRRRDDPCHIAWLDLWGKDEVPIPILKPLLEGAQARAEELGYGIEVYRVVKDGLRIDRLRQILMTRGQWGIIIPPVPESAMNLSLDLSGLAGVTIGTSLHRPIMHRVAPNHFQIAQLAFDRLRSKGFCRIGLALSAAKNQRVEGRWLGAYLARQCEIPTGQKIPPLIMENSGQREFLAWLKEYEPDVVMLGELHVMEWMSMMAFPRKKRPAIACLAHEITQSKVQGIDCQPKRIGAAAVEHVISQIHRNERGIPPEPHTTYLDGVWVDH